MNAAQLRGLVSVVAHKSEDPLMIFHSSGVKSGIWGYLALRILLFSPLTTGRTSVSGHEERGRDAYSQTGSANCGRAEKNRLRDFDE